MVGTVRNSRSKMIRSSTCSVSRMGKIQLPPFVYTQTFLADDTWTVPAHCNYMEYLVVGGGGGGGGAFDNAGAGGGGGGQVVTGSYVPTCLQTLTIQVGSGGNGGTANRLVAEFNGDNGNDSKISATIGTAIVEAKGGQGGYKSRGYKNGTISKLGGLAATMTSAAEGGTGGGGGSYGGGGGGSSGNGATGSTVVFPNPFVLPAAGGTGTIYNSISYGNGGNGGSNAAEINGTNGSPNTGNGGAGGSAEPSTDSDGGNGGSGIVIIRYTVLRNDIH